MVAAARAIPEHTSSSFPLGVQEPAGVLFGLHLSSLTPYALLQNEMQPTERRPPRGDGTLLSSVKEAYLPPFPLLTFTAFLKMLGSLPTVKNKQCRLWSWAASNCSQKLNLSLLQGKRHKVNTRSTFLFNLLLWAQDTREGGPVQPFAGGSFAALEIRPPLP